MRTLLPLNDDWYFKPSFNEADLKMVEIDPSLESVRLPHTNKILPHHYFDEASFQFHSCYIKKLPKIKLAENQMAVIHFEGIMTYAEVYLSGTKLTEHKGGYTPFSVDITEYLNENEPLLIVHVDSTERPDIPPFGFVVDYLTYGGIYREVQLEIKNKIHLTDLKVETPKGADGVYSIDIRRLFQI